MGMEEGSRNSLPLDILNRKSTTERQTIKDEKTNIEPRTKQNKR
jgi:hypothetical protein